jgi:hypothetical protein
VLHFELPQSTAPTVPGAVRVTGAERVWTVICESSRIDRAAISRNFGVRIADESPASLDEVFIAHTSVAPEALPSHSIAS